MSHYQTIDVAGYIYESSATGIVAGTTRTQAGATALGAEFNRVDTATAPTAGTVAGDGVALPPAPGGQELTIIVWNNTANPITVYANGSDTINGVAGSTGIVMPPNSIDTFIAGAGSSGQWAVEAGVGFAANLPTVLACDTITANATGTQAAATVLPADFNHVTTAANTSAPYSAVALPAAKPGLDVYVENTTSNPIQVFPTYAGGAGTDTINGLAANASIVIPATSTAIFACTLAGAWTSNPYFNAVGSLPGNVNTQMGASAAATGAARPGGNLSAQQAGTIGASTSSLGNAADATDDVLFAFTLPASIFDVAGRQVTINADGYFAANAHNKRFKIIFNPATAVVGSAVGAGGTVVADSGVVTTNGGGWNAQGVVTKYGAAGSNTQKCAGQASVTGAHQGCTGPNLATATESGTILVAVTGSSPTSSAANDVYGVSCTVGFNN
jgi:hypothetical protein